MIKILNKQEKKEIKDNLNYQFGIEDIPGMLVKMGEERLFIFTGSLSENNIKHLEKNVFIERLGIYFARIVPGEDAIKLSVEGIQILKHQIKKNILELNEKQAEEWMMGRDLQIRTGKRGFMAMKYKNDFLGCGKASDEKIGNFIPKSRRLREKGN